MKDVISQIGKLAAWHLVGGYFNKGDAILYGKYKNKKGIIREFKTDDRGHPVVVVDQIPNPTGRKQPKELQLYRIWKAPQVKGASSAAQSAAESLLRDAPDESIEDLIEMVRGTRIIIDPESRSTVKAGDVIKSLEKMIPKPVPGGIKVYHSTDSSTANMFLRRGFIPETKPRRLVDTYSPGVGLDRGLYVGESPRAVESYGRVILEVNVPKKFLEVPTELAQLGETNPMDALRSHDGAIINERIPASAFRMVGGRVASRRKTAQGDCYEANGQYFMEKALFPGKDKSLQIVHGEVMGQGPMEGISFGHCWVEDGRTVIDKSNGRNIRMPKQLYYFMGRIHELDNIHVYDPEEFRANILKYENWGPWDLKTSTGY